MNDEQPPIPHELQNQLETVKSLVWSISQQYQGDLSSLLSLLRTLEGLHRDIREQLFEPSLPDTRKDLYHLLKEIEESGGWPYIERMRLQFFIKNFLNEDDSSSQTH